MRFLKHPLTAAALILSVLACWQFGPELVAKYQLHKLNLKFDPDSFIKSACKNDETALGLYLKAGMDVRVSTPSGLTALHCAATTGSTEMVALLLSKKAPVDARTNEMRTPLHMAVGNSHRQVVNLLIDHGADVNAHSNFGPPVFDAAGMGNISLIQVLIDKGADIHAVDKSGGNALNAAIDGVRFESTIRFLLEKGVSPEGQSRKGPALLSAADNANILLLLLSKGANPNIAAADGTTALHAAIARNNMEVIEALLAAGSRVNVLSKRFATPLHQAADSGNVTVAELLLKRGADVNAVDCCNKKTPLHVAVSKVTPQSESMTTVLLTWGANPDARDNAGRTPLIEARNAPPSIVHELVSKGADVNARDSQGNSVLWWFRNRNSPASSYLVSKGAKI